MNTVAKSKRYGATDDYEKKLSRVMERLGVDRFDWDHNRREAWVEFWYKGQMYRFEHSVAKSENSDEPLTYGSDCFAQIVLTLEDLARMVRRGIYDLGAWVAGMKFLAAPVQLPWWATELGLDRIPSDESQITTQYRLRAKTAHPDGGGTDEAIKRLTKARDEGLIWLRTQAKM
jgi:hypothetical protein